MRGQAGEFMRVSVRIRRVVRFQLEQVCALLMRVLAVGCPTPTGDRVVSPREWS